LNRRPAEIARNSHRQDKPDGKKPQPHLASTFSNHNRIYQDQSEQHLVLRDGNDDQDGVVEYVERGATMTGAVVV
jgi:hypothetical protein